MKLIVTGGGTGGHIYPALEVAKLAQSQGDTVAYFGSLRGQESKACKATGFEFQGFPSQPLYSLKTVRGMKALLALLKAKSMAKKALTEWKPNAVFSTGGYSAGPVVAAAKALGIPYFIHEANSVPGRSNLIFAKEAAAFTTLFKATDRFAEGVKCQRVGNPIRAELREAVSRRKPERDLVLCVGGSQGSEFLNGCVPAAVAKLPGVRLLIASGPNNFEKTSAAVARLGAGDRITVRPYLETSEMLDAYCRAAMVVGRSGSTLAELAMFGIPSVLVPLPTAAGNHQLHNAEEFEQMKAAVTLRQSDATPETMSEAILWWFETESRIPEAESALSAWNLPDATQTIYDLIKGASK